MNFPVSTSYLRTKSSLPSLPMRYTLRPAASVVTVFPSSTAIGKMLAGAAVARHDIEVSCRRMRPGVLDIGRQRDRATLCQGGVGYVDVKERELRPDAGIQDGFGHSG